MGYKKNRGENLVSSLTSNLTPILLLVGGYFVYKAVSGVGKSLNIFDDKDDDAVNRQTQNINNSAWDANYWKKTGGKIYTVADSKKLLDELSSYFGYFNDDEAKIYGWFRKIHSKVGLSWLCYQYRLLYKQDMYTDLTSGNFFNQSGLTNSEMAIVLNIVNQLPNKL